jgi:hypothetical protein
MYILCQMFTGMICWKSFPLHFLKTFWWFPKKWRYSLNNWILIVRILYQMFIEYSKIFLNILENDWIVLWYQWLKRDF